MRGPERLQRIFFSFFLWGAGIPLCDPTIWIRRAHGGRHSDGAERHVARSVKQEFAKWSASIRDLLAGRTSSSTSESPHEARPNGARGITARIGGIFHSDRCMARLGVLSMTPPCIFIYLYVQYIGCSASSSPSAIVKSRSPPVPVSADPGKLLHASRTASYSTHRTQPLPSRSIYSIHRPISS
jgi:hypothetical protein